MKIKLNTKNSVYYVEHLNNKCFISGGQFGKEKFEIEPSYQLDGLGNPFYCQFTNDRFNCQYSGRKFKTSPIQNISLGEQNSEERNLNKEKYVIQTSRTQYTLEPLKNGFFLVNGGRFCNNEVEILNKNGCLMKGQKITFCYTNNRELNGKHIREMVCTSEITDITKTNQDSSCEMEESMNEELSNTNDYSL